MPRKETSIPKTSADVKKLQKQVRRRYKVNPKKRVKVTLGKEEFNFRMVIILELAGYSRTQMAKIIGISKNQVKELLESPQSAEQINFMRERIPGAALELIQNYMIEAVQTIVDVMRTTPADEMRLKAAGDLLDRGGAAKASRTEQSVHKVNEERHTFTNDGIVDAIRQLPPEKQEEAAQMMEKFEQFLSDAAAKEMEPDGES